MVKQSNKDKHDYRVQLNAIVDCIRFLLCQGLAFRGHDESQGSSDKGNFLELVQFLGDHNESINEVLQTAPKNCKLTYPWFKTLHFAHLKLVPLAFRNPSLRLPLEKHIFRKKQI